MYARYLLSAHNTPALAGESMISVDGRWPVAVRVSKSEDHDDTISLEAKAKFSPPPDVFRVFEDLANGVLPSDSEPYVTLGTRVEPGAELRGVVPASEILPEPFRSFSRDLRSDLSSATRRILALHRWASDTYIPDRRPTSTRGSSFSLDGTDWHSLPSTGSTRVWGAAFFRLDDGQFERVIQPLVDAGLEEPIGFDLLAEAAEVSGANPRSALVVAIAAAEVGVKAFIATVVPDAKWLVMEAPTPPLATILEQYLPKLSVPNPLPSGRVSAPPSSTVDLIRNAYRLRNGIIHAGHSSSVETVDETITAVGDILRLLDYYLGQKWARQFMSYEFAVALGLRERDERLEGPSIPTS